MVRHDSFTIERHFDVPPGEIFAAFADTVIRRRWFRLPGSAASYEQDFRVGGGETARSTFTGLDGPPEQLEYRSRYIDITHARRIVYGYEAAVDGQLRWTSLVTIRLDAETPGTRLAWTEQVALLRYAGDGNQDLAHLRGGTALRLNGLDPASGTASHAVSNSSESAVRVAGSAPSDISHGNHKIVGKDRT